MALALSRFGSFEQLFKGYSSLEDGDVPTLYWAPAQYNATQGVDFGNFYTSKYVNFLSIDYASPITQGYTIPPLTYFQHEAEALRNPIYSDATNILIGLNDYVGTPDTVWGSYSVPGADAMDLGPRPLNNTSSRRFRWSRSPTTKSWRCWRAPAPISLGRSTRRPTTTSPWSARAATSPPLYAASLRSRPWSPRFGHDPKSPRPFVEGELAMHGAHYASAGAFPLTL